MSSVGPGLGFARFVYRRCYGYWSCVFQRFIRYLINRCLINTSFTASSVVITILWIDCVWFSDVSPSSKTGKDMQWRSSRPWLRMNWHEAPLVGKRYGATNLPDKSCATTVYDLSRDKTWATTRTGHICVFWYERSIDSSSQLWNHNNVAS